MIQTICWHGWRLALALWFWQAASLPDGGSWQQIGLIAPLPNLPGACTALGLLPDPEAPCPGPSGGQPPRGQILEQGQGWEGLDCAEERPVDEGWFQSNWGTSAATGPS